MSEKNSIQKTKPTLVVFSHGKESGPNGTKIQALQKVSEELGYMTVSLDYTLCKNEVERKVLLREFLSNQKEKLILVGSSMGGYVSAALANEFDLIALFLMCPALELKEFEPVEFFPRTDRIVLVHGWGDDIVPVASSINFARQHKATLHITDDGHRLTDSIPQLIQWFRDLLLSTSTNSNS